MPISSAQPIWSSKHRPSRTVRTSDADEANIYTDYSFTLNEIMKNRRRSGLLKAGHTIVVRRESGTVMINGLRATTIENGFAPFAENGRYLLFLKQLVEQNAYAVIGGGRGAFEVGDHIAPMLDAMRRNSLWRGRRSSAKCVRC